MRRHQNAEAGGVDEMDRGKSSPSCLLRPRTDATQMSRIAQRHRAKAGLPRLGDREDYGLAADHLTVAELTIDDGVARRLADNEGLPVGVYTAFGRAVEGLGTAM